MADIEVKAHGTLLFVGNGAGPEVFTEIARLTDIDPPGIANEDDDVTNHNETRFRKFIMTLAQVEEFTVEITYNNANTTHDALLADTVTPVIRNYKVGFTDGSDWVFPAWAKKFKPKTPKEGAFRADVTFRPSGEPTLTDA